jgi:hypothetical protein
VAISKPDQITAKLIEPFPLDLIEHKNGLSYLPHEIIRDRLIEATGNCFDWSIDQVLFRDDGVTRRPADRSTGEPRRPHSMIVIGTLTIPGLGSRAGIGAHPLDEGAGEDAAYKSAESDALKRAAMAFGVGLRQLYIDKANQARGTRPRTESAPAASRANSSQTRQPEPISDAAFTSEVERAVSSRDNEAIRRLVTVASSNIARWIVLVNAAASESALAWMERQISQRGLEHKDLNAALAARRMELAA